MKESKPILMSPFARIVEGIFDLSQNHIYYSELSFSR